jgi:hypothetical protein
MQIKEYSVIISISLLVLTLVIILHPIERLIYAASASTEVGRTFDSGSQRHRSYWTPTNVTAPSGMIVLHIILDGTDSTFKLGNKGLKACIDFFSAPDKG